MPHGWRDRETVADALKPHRRRVLITRPLLYRGRESGTGLGYSQPSGLVAMFSSAKRAFCVANASYPLTRPRVVSYFAHSLALRNL